jgi:transposase-like protein
MAGNPKRRTDVAKLETLGSDTVGELLEQGKSLTDICRTLAVSKRALNDWLDAPEQSGLLSRARARAADQLAAETLTIADQATPEDAQVARLRTDVRKWLAGKWSPSLYGENKGASVNISITGLHGDSLRKPVIQVIEAIDETEQIGHTLDNPD